MGNEENERNNKLDQRGSQHGSELNSETTVDARLG